MPSAAIALTPNSLNSAEDCRPHNRAIARPIPRIEHERHRDLQPKTTRSDGPRRCEHVRLRITSSAPSLSSSAKLRERTSAGMKAAKKRGQHVGRPFALAGTRLETARKMLGAGKSQTEVARILRVSRATIQRAQNQERPFRHFFLTLKRVENKPLLRFVQRASPTNAEDQRQG